MKTSGAEKKELMNKAFNDIAVVYNLYPHMGGKNWRTRYNLLLMDIQRSWGSRKEMG